MTVTPGVLSADPLGLSSDRFSLPRIGEALRGHQPRTIEGATHAAAVALVLRPAGSGLEALFIRRADHPNDPWSGHVGLPGGRAEGHDEGLVHTAIRETEEEIGLSLASDRDLLGALDETRATARTKSIDMKIAPFVFSAPDAPDQLTLSDEVAATHWIPLLELFDSVHAASLTMQHAGQTLRFPAIEIRGLTIWGLTLRMLRNFETLTRTP
jgi:8-oxo-dGTP pyrophosphatase MutT (NUDIX family)